MGISRSTTQSPTAYSNQNLTGPQLAARMAATAAAAQTANLRTATQDTGYRLAISPGETAAGFVQATDLNLGYDPCDSRRYKFDLTGATDVTAIFQKMLDAAGKASNGETVVVVVYPGTYLLTRVYMHYSNVHLCLLPGAILQQKITFLGTGSITGNVLTISAVTSGALAVGDQIISNGVGSSISITSFGTGAGGVGTYNVSATPNVPSQTVAVIGHGVNNNNTAGQSPAYALIHINPLTYVNSPSSGAAGVLTNVKIYGGGTVKGPFTATPGAYLAYTLGIVSNDCNKCWIQEINFDGFGSENALHGPSAWNTCTDLRLVGCEVQHGGEFAVNNGRDFIVANNYVHDSWMQNGCGGNGDGGIVAMNRVRSMFGAGMSFGGSGARDINADRNVIVAFNTIENTNLSNAGSGVSTFAMLLSDDGATTTPKLNIQICHNTIDLNQSGGGAMIGCDYNSGNVEICYNSISGGTSPGAASTGIAVIAGSATYNLRGNHFHVGAGNMLTCHDVLGGTPTVNLWSYHNQNLTNDYLHPSLFAIIDQQRDFSTTLVMTGCTASINVPAKIIKRGKRVTIDFAGTTGVSNSTTKTLTGLSTECAPSANKNFFIAITDNGVNAVGLLQITPAGGINLFKDINAGAFTASGNAGISGPYSVSYTTA